MYYIITIPICFLHFTQLELELLLELEGLGSMQNLDAKNLISANTHMRITNEHWHRIRVTSDQINRKIVTNLLCDTSCDDSLSVITVSECLTSVATCTPHTPSMRHYVQSTLRVNSLARLSAHRQCRFGILFLTFSTFS